jgi:hypothetical protein
MTRLDDARHGQIRSTLRLIGPGVAIVGLIFLAVGLVDFFGSFGSFEPPRKFWCLFVGMPLLAIGAGISKFAYLGSISRYMAGEFVPVGRDVVNEMAHGTRGAVRTMAAAVGEGLRDGSAAREGRGVRCAVCQAENDAEANYCKGCGASLSPCKGVDCPACGTPNEGDARFCDHCGTALS